MNCPMQLFLRGGYSVMLYDVISEQLGGAVTAVADKLAIMEKEGLLKDGECIEMKLFYQRLCAWCMGGKEG